MNSAAPPIAAQAVSDADAAAPVDAVARLEQSRQRLRRHLIELNGSGDGPPGSRPSNALLDALKSIPLLGMVLDTVSNWWSQHPLRVVATLVAASAASVAKPVTQRHPTLTLFAALAVGGLVMWARPWRFALLRRAVYAGLLPQFVSKMLSRLPTGGWVTLADSLLRRGKATPASTPRTAKPVVPRSPPPGSAAAAPSALH